MSNPIGPKLPNSGGALPVRPQLKRQNATRNITIGTHRSSGESQLQQQALLQQIIGGTPMKLPFAKPINASTQPINKDKENKATQQMGSISEAQNAISAKYKEQAQIAHQNQMRKQINTSDLPKALGMSRADETKKINQKAFEVLTKQRQNLQKYGRELNPVAAFILDEKLSQPKRAPNAANQRYEKFLKNKFEELNTRMESRAVSQSPKPTSKRWQPIPSGPPPSINYGKLPNIKYGVLPPDQNSGSPPAQP